jgi:RHS repeat-associated protein
MMNEFGLINMNGRLYDPTIARMLSPDNFVQDATSVRGFNRYTYVLNNPLKYKDPSGEFLVIDSWLLGFIHGFFSTGNNKFNAAWKEANKRSTNDIRIWGGLFVSDPNQNFFGKVIEVTSRLTWQLPQTILGFMWNHLINTFTSRVEKVEYFYGATYVVGATSYGNAVTLGSFISISRPEEDRQSYIKIGDGGFTTMHEYGHYLQSKKSGSLYLLKYGIPYAIADADWTEIDANTRAARYFKKIEPSFNWKEIPGDRYRMLSDRIYDPRWFEYPIFFLGGAVGQALIIFKNWKEPW